MNATVNHDTHVAHIEAVVARQRTFFETSATRPVAVRVAALRRLKKEMQKREKILLDALQADLNKSHFEGYMCELGLNLDELGYLADHVRAWSQPRRKPTPLPQFKSSSYELPEPYGVVLIMAPWNYPYLLSLDPLFGAVAAGNCVVLKPSAYAPNTSRAMAELLAAVFPPEWVTVIEGGREQNAALLEQRFDYIFFTGSVDVGKLVMEKASRHLTPVTLELGGKSANIYFDDCKWDMAIDGLQLGILFNQGQVCCAGSRVFVQEGIYDKFVEAAVKAFNSVNVGDPLDPNTQMGAQVDQGQLRKIMSYVNLAKEEGATIACGGEPYTDGACANGSFMKPTLIVNATNDMRVAQEEIFGPVAVVIKFKTEEEVIAMANDSVYGLGGAVWTRDINRAIRVARGVETGRMWVNTYNQIPSGAPFGGYKQSGIGRETHKVILEHYTQQKNIMINLNETPSGFYPEK